MRADGSRALWWLSFAALWLLMAGSTDSRELVAAAVAGLVGVFLVGRLRAARVFRGRVDAPMLASAWKAPYRIVLEFGLVMLVLLRAAISRQRVQGSFLEVPFAAGEASAEHNWRRAFATLIGTLAPNRLVIDIDRERGVARVHALDAKRPSVRELP